MSKFTDSLLDPSKPTVQLYVRETPSGGYKLRMMSIDKPATDGGLFRSAKSDT